jgi:hypothetical protein
MKVIFTIVSRNYLGLARVLGESLRRAEPGINFYVFTADAVDAVVKTHYPFPIIEAKSTIIKDENLWNECAFKYNVTEFCTFLKPYAFKYLFTEMGISDAIYLDPDIFVFSSFDEVWNALENKSIVLTPHILSLQEHYGGAVDEVQFLQFGIYNLGFLALNSNLDNMSFLSWWALRLNDHCYSVSTEGYFTDQKWANFIPVFFHDSYYLLNHLGSDVAPWNFHEREIVNTSSGYAVKLRGSLSPEVQKLIFIHFSGLDFKSINLSRLTYKDNGIMYEEDIVNMIRFYKEKLEEFSFNQYFGLGYEHQLFDNGVVIIDFYRRLYGGYLKRENRKVINPFLTSDGTFYSVLKRNGLLSKKAVTQKLGGLNNEQIHGKRWKVEILIRLMKLLLGVDRFMLIMEYLNNNTTPDRLVYLLRGVSDLNK